MENLEEVKLPEGKLIRALFSSLLCSVVYRFDFIVWVLYRCLD
jgi:hypothetical protein